ncbi:MAG TPA: HD domain-containing protein [Candidatus Hydrogenedentes bacterium]|nr:HD domain-containing protein [Candidatus Hydrogenedentota bacterium]HOH50666.1 HD domain-containing protein [Candidatus Hydrogenedentota bacterium]
MIADILTALHFAALKHRDQRRKDAGASPYINHPIEVAELLARVGGVNDPAVLIAALLHDTVEDTETTFDEVEALFGAEVRGMVAEVTDDNDLPKAERKRLQIVHAPHLSPGARQIKLADKISNVKALVHTPPAKWSTARRREYIAWCGEVVAGLRGCGPALEALFDAVHAEAERVLGPGGE